MADGGNQTAGWKADGGRQTAVAVRGPLSAVYMASKIIAASM